MNRNGLLAVSALACCCAQAIASDAGENSPQAQAVGNAKADGTAVALAVFCATPKDVIARYAHALQTASKRHVEENKLDFSDADYRESAEAGFDWTMEFMYTLNPDPENKRENCEGVEAKIKRTLAGESSSDQ